jgi:hypothetical protein
MHQMRCYIEKLEREVIHGTRKQEEIHIEAKTKGIED